MEQTIYLIQGIIFQQGTVFGLGNRPGIGLAVTMETAMLYAIYHGVVGPSEDKESFSGNMTDKYGKSEITDFKINDNSLSFNKYYEGNRPVIKYEFTKKGLLWIGTFEGDDCGSGESNCIVTETDTSFFIPTK